MKATVLFIVALTAVSALRPLTKTQHFTALAEVSESSHDLPYIFLDRFPPNGNCHSQPNFSSPLGIW